MKAEIKIFVRKSDHYNYKGDNKYNTRIENITGTSEQDILDNFYKKTKRCDASFYIKFTSKNWNEKYKNWLNSEDYKKRSFNLFYENSIVD